MASSLTILCLSLDILVFHLLHQHLALHHIHYCLETYLGTTLSFEAIDYPRTISTISSMQWCLQTELLSIIDFLLQNIIYHYHHHYRYYHHDY